MILAEPITMCAKDKPFGIPFKHQYYKLIVSSKGAFFISTFSFIKKKNTIATFIALQQNVPRIYMFININNKFTFININLINIDIKSIKIKIFMI